jgi:hypothetical protein
VKRGFKTKAEQSAAEARLALGLRAIERLDPWAHATQLGVEVLDFSTLGLSAHDIAQLTLVDADSWSGMTIKEGTNTAIILNPSQPKTRQCSTLMHEFAHLELGHVPARVDVSPAGLLLLSEYDEAQEEEADFRIRSNAVCGPPKPSRTGW